MTDDKRKLGNPVSAVLTALKDIKDPSGGLPPVDPAVRVDGKTCLVTGANSGLGKAIATDLARRGATLILACRSGIPGTAEDISGLTGNTKITMEHVDLLDLRSVDALCDRLSKAGVRLDRLILNAGLMAPKAKPSAQGFEKMLAVHFLANERLITQLVDAGVIPRDQNARIVTVSSESHRSAPPIDFATFGEISPHNMGSSMKQYGHSKLALSLMIRGLANRYRHPDGTPEIGVFHMCPGPVNSNIARNAPAWLRPLVSGMMGALFPSPEKAAEPVIHLACSPDLDGKTGLYMHLMRFRDPSEAAMDDDAAARIVAFGEAVFAQHEMETTSARSA